MESKQNYLLAIYRLTSQGENSTTTSQIAKQLEVSDASTSEAIKKLEKEKLVCRAPYKGFTLSPMGKKQAEKLDKKYKVTKQFLQETLQVEKAEQQAEKIKHHLTSETIQKLEELNSDSTSL